ARASRFDLPGRIPRIASARPPSAVGAAMARRVSSPSSTLYRDLPNGPLRGCSTFNAEELNGSLMHSPSLIVRSGLAEAYGTRKAPVRRDHPMGQSFVS